jgi:uncharacterized protein
MLEVSFGTRLFRLIPQKALLDVASKALIISDLHLGKVPYFRAAGIPVPQGAADADLKVLEHLLDQQKPQHLIILGDFFHATHNADWNLWMAFRNKFSELTITLVMGNHDRLASSWYETASMQVVPQMALGDLLLVHEPATNPEVFQISGHLHPGISLLGKGRQRLRLPCFVMEPHQLILPAFGQFTGLAISRKQNPPARYFAVGENLVWEVKGFK